MKDASTIWDEAARDARAQVIATEVVVALRSQVTGEPLTPEQIDTVTMQSIQRAVMQLKFRRCDHAMLNFLDDLDTELAALRFDMRVQLGLVQLAGVMGRHMP